MEIRVNVLGKVAYIQGESRDNKAKAELYPSGEGVYAVMGWRRFRLSKSCVFQDS